MDKFQVINSFWSSFGVPAYDENTVPTAKDRPDFPYITYDVSVNDFGYPVALSGSIWDYGTAWERITAKLAEIEAYLGRGGVMLPCDGGAVWIVKGSPFAQRMADDNDMIRRIFINISAEFITA